MYCIDCKFLLSQELNGKGLKANEWIGHIQSSMNGKGGGKEMSAQATGTNTSCLNQVLNMATQYVEEKLGVSGSSSDGPAEGGDVGLTKLNVYLADHSYIEGYTPSQADVTVYKALGKQPSSQYVHINRYIIICANFPV